MQHLGYGPPLLLIASSYASRTRAKYEAAANRFAHWGESRDWRPRTHQQFDFYLTESISVVLVSYIVCINR